LVYLLVVAFTARLLPLPLPLTAHPKASSVLFWFRKGLLVSIRTEDERDMRIASLFPSERKLDSGSPSPLVSPLALGMVVRREAERILQSSCRVVSPDYRLPTEQL
jgi:hypothetical protein